MFHVIIGLGLTVLVLVSMGFTMRRLYVPASMGMALVREGYNGEQVRMHSGGVLVLPALHELIRVNLKQHKLLLFCDTDNLIVFRDGHPSTFEIEFSYRVEQRPDAILLAARNLGNITQDTNELNDFIESRFLHGVRAVTGRFTQDEIMQDVNKYIKEIRVKIDDYIHVFGLELESCEIIAVN